MKLFLLLLGIICHVDLFSQTSTDDHYVWIENAMILDVDNLGKTTHDIDNGCILIHNNEIEWVGSCTDTPSVPMDASYIDATGKYVMPGLFDGFAAINNQSYCDAMLYLGITNVIAVDGGRRGTFFADGDPSPNIYRLEGVGDEKISNDSLIYQLNNYHALGYKVMLLMYGLTPGQLKLAIVKCAKLGMATIGELGFTTYEKGLELGLQAVVHTTRYSMDIAPRDMAIAVANEPFSNDLQSPKWQYYKYLTHLQKDEDRLMRHAEVLGGSNTFLLPTSSLSYLDLPDHKNPWLEPAAKIIDIKDINRPADPLTGNHRIDSTEQAAYSSLIHNELTVIEPAYYSHGAKYLAGSGTDVWGTMPGISLHTELWILHNKIGLTIRETLAAATTNYAVAFGWKNGKIGIGYQANIIILNENPLEDLENLKQIETVILRGQVHQASSFLH